MCVPLCAECGKPALPFYEEPAYCSGSCSLAEINRLLQQLIESQEKRGPKHYR